MPFPTDRDTALALPTGMLAALVGEAMARVVCTERVDLRIGRTRLNQVLDVQRDSK